VTVQAGEDGIRYCWFPVAWYGPIVMTTDAELEQAYAELRNRTFTKQRD